MNLYYMFFELLLRDICSFLLDNVRFIFLVVFIMIVVGNLCEINIKKIKIKFCKKYIYDDV